MGAILTFLLSLRPNFLRRQVEYPNSLQDVCEDNLRKLDDSVVKLLVSIDAMQATADMLYRHLSISNRATEFGPGNVSRDIRGCKATAARLLINIERIVSDERQDFISSLRTFLNFVILNGGRPFQSNSIRQLELKIDEYETDPNVLQLTGDGHIKELQNENEDLIMKIDGYSVQVKSLQDEIGELKSNLELERHDSKRRVEHVQNENNKLKEKVSNLQKQNNNMKQNKESQSQQLKKLEADKTDIEKKKTALHKELTKSQKERDSRINELQQQSQKDKALLQSLEEELKLKDKENADLHIKYDKELRKKEQCFIELQQEMGTVSVTVESCKETIRNKDQEIKDLSSVVERKEVGLSELEQKHQKALELARKDKDTYECTLKVKDGKLTKLSTRVKHLEQQIRNKEQAIETYELDNIVMREDKKKICTQLEEVSEQFKVKNDEILALQEKVEEHNVEIQDKKRELEEKETVLQELREEMEKKVLQLHLLQTECDKLKLDHDTIMARYHEVNAELTDIKSIKSIPVQLLCQQNTQWTSDLQSNLHEMLITEMKSVDDKIELNIFKTTRPSDVRPEIPLLLICVTISRLGTDATSAMQGLTLTSNMAMVVFHHKDEHALPNQASERVLTGKEMRECGGIFDMAFKSDKGIYSCDMNTKTIQSLVTFLRRQII